MRVTSAYAKANLPELLKIVETGETVRITRYNKPIACIVPYADREAVPKLGTAPKTVKLNDPDWARALTAQEMKNLLEKGSY